MEQIHPTTDAEIENIPLMPKHSGQHGKLLFELRGADGHEWRLWENGYCEGFPPGTILSNYAASYIGVLLGLVSRSKQDVPVKATPLIVRGIPVGPEIQVGFYGTQPQR